MVELTKDEMKVNVLDDKNKVRVRRLIEEEYDYEEYLRAIRQIEFKIDNFETDAKTNKKMLEDFGGLREIVTKLRDFEVKEMKEATNENPDNAA